jgi:hypothetical protein
MIPKYNVWLGQARIMRQGWEPKFALLLDGISQEVKLYEQAFSAMAKRNIAVAIHEKVADFEKTWKKAYGLKPMPKLLAELGESARKDAVGNVGARKYEYVCCIGHGIATGKFDENLFKASWDGSNYQFSGIVAYTGDQRDRADYLAKCGRMVDAIKMARQLYQSEHGGSPQDAKTLKLFMAPEFYFRGLQGAYDIGCVSEIATKLRNFTQGAKFSDWLFVLGTVIGATFDDRLVCTQCGKSGAKSFQRVGVNQFVCPGCPPDSVKERRLGARIDNVALIQKGGESDDRNAYVVTKEYVSHIDFRRRVSSHALKKGEKATGYDNVAILNNWNKDRRIEVRGETLRALAPSGSRDVGGGQPSSFLDERMGGSIFTIDGIKFGLEICLDHLNQRLSPGAGVQIQLVPSAGASLKQFACVSDGVAFNVDGLAGKCDMRVNSTGGAPSATPELANTTRGNITVYEPVPIP